MDLLGVGAAPPELLGTQQRRFQPAEGLWRNAERLVRPPAIALVGMARKPRREAVTVPAAVTLSEPANGPVVAPQFASAREFDRELELERL